MAPLFSQPRFSIVLPCCNDGAVIAGTLASMAAQQYGDYELLVIETGASEETRRILTAAAAADDRIRLVRSPGLNRAAARNRAIDLARAELLAFCEPGDKFEPYKLTIMDEVFAASEIDAAFGRVGSWRGPRGRCLPVDARGDLTLGRLMQDNPVVTLSNLCVRAPVFRASHGFDPALDYHDDMEWLIRLVGGGYRVVPVEAPVTQFSLADSRLSGDLGGLWRGRDAVRQSAHRFGQQTDPRNEATHLRLLAHRALCSGVRGRTALKYALAGIGTSPRGYFSDPRGGVGTLLGCLVSMILPAGLRRALF
ncbi:glycosyltransferase family 2 protein [Pseudooceanicola algae]|uniref:Glycosyltransferase 2-like domain-containing protein n=1 Tax=Pseudooceanicola algae TaxID=1537215 RepID=A0A418SJU4_9RHOB|nr:glycosyltransferase family A protein [Pseudooceanicola algae]QPM88806.1 hypothetical protein PSAL_000080 [Pseudooceanicola algae]